MAGVIGAVVNVTWYTSALVTILFWGIADTFYKRGSSYQVQYSHWRIVVMVGLVMGLQAF